MSRHGALALCLLAFACTSEPAAPDLSPKPLRPPQDAPSEKQPSGLSPAALRRGPRVELELSDAEAPAAPRGEPAVSRTLDKRQTEEALALVAAPPPAAEPSPIRPGRRPPSVPPAAESFPRPHTTGEASAEPFTASMTWPQGDAAAPSELRVSFTRKVAGVQPGAVARRLPVELDPDLPGEWRWLDEYTLTFRPKMAFPKATSFKVEIARTLRSSEGEELDRRIAWSFTTPAPRVVATVPALGDARRGAWPRTAPLLVLFDQPVRAGQSLGALKLEAAGRSVPLRLATREEIDRDATLRRAVAAAPPSHWMAVRAVDQLPPQTEARLTVGPGVASVEGARLSTETTTLVFSTDDAFQEIQTSCFWAPAPFLLIELEFNARLDPAAFEEESFSTTPALARRKVTLTRDGERSRVSIVGIPEANGPVEIRHTAALAAEDGVRQALPGQLTCVPPALPDAQTFPALLSLTADGKLALPLTAPMRLRARAWPAAPSQWPTYAERMESRLRPWQPEEAPAFDQELEAKPENGQAWLDFSTAFGSGSGSGSDLLVSLTRAGEANPFHVLWLQRSPVRLTAARIGDDLAVLALSVAGASPLAGLNVSAGGASAITDASGLALLRGVDRGARFVEASGDAGRGWTRLTPRPGCRAALYDPRAALVPGTTSKLAGRACAGTNRAPVRAEFSLASDRRIIARGQAPVDAEGRFDLTLALPADAPEGSAELRVALIAADGVRLDELSSLLVVRKAAPSHASLSVLPVARSTALGAPLLFRADAASDARPLAGARVAWEVTTRPAKLEFSGLQDFVFWSARAGWSQLAPEIEALEEPDRCRSVSSPARRTGLAGPNGSHTLRVQPRGGDPVPLEILAEARLTDPVELRSAARAIVHPGSVIPGLRSASLFHRQGDQVEVEVVAVDQSGQRATGSKVLVRAVGERWRPHLGGWRRETIDPQECEVTAQRVPVKCSFRLAEKAVYRVAATARDVAGRISQSELGLWVEGAAFPPRRTGTTETLELFAERETQAAGGMAKLLLRSGTAGVRALLHVSEDGRLREARVVELKERSVYLDLPVGERGLTVEALAPWQHGTSWTDPVRIAPGGRQPRSLSALLETEPAGPGRLTARVELRDGQGDAAAGAELVLAAFDSALDLGTPEDPSRGPGLSDLEFLPAQPPQGYSGDARNACASAAEDPYRVHHGAGFLLKEAPPLPALDPVVRTWRLATDAEGRAEAKLELPQAARYLLRVLAVDPRRGPFVAAEARAALGAPVEVRIVAPRVARPGDLAEALLFLKNRGETPLDATVATRISGGRLAGPAAVEIELPPGRPVELSLPIEVERAAEVALKLLVRAGGWAAPLEATVAVETDLEREVLHGRFETGAFNLPVVVPRRAGEKLGGLHLALSPSPLSGLSDALLALIERPSDETAVLAWRLLALSSLGDGIGALAAPGLPGAPGLAALAREDLSRLTARQLPDGGFRAGADDEAGLPFVNVLSADALARAKAAGLPVPEPALANVRAMLAGLGARLAAEPDARDAIEAYALNVRARLGERDLEAARAIAARALDGHSAETIAWLTAPLAGDPMAAQLERWLEGRQLRDEAGVHYAAVYRSGADQVLHSEHRADAVVLEALAAAGRDPDRQALLAQGLTSHRIGGRWTSSGENAFGIAALSRYWRAAGPAPTGASAWLGGAFLGELRFGAGPRVAQVSVPMELLVARPRNYELVMEKQGAGPLFYRVELDWSDGTEDRRLGGFGVERSYLPVEPRGLERDLRAGWRARVGTRIKVRLQLFVPTCARGAVVSDALPAGFEPAGGLRVVDGRSCAGRAYAPELRRGPAGVTAWLGDLGPGLHVLEYNAIAVARGDWRAPPARLSDSTGQRAVGGSDRIAVE